MPTYKTPDVYVEEISVFPPSVAEVETAVPAFVGYTEKAESKNKGLTGIPTKIYSLKEFESYFGGPHTDVITVKVTDDPKTGPKVETVTEPTLSYLLYYSVRMYFNNGGGQCYIVSVGGYKEQPTIDGIVLVKPFGFWTNYACSLAEPPTLSSRSSIRATA